MAEQILVVCDVCGRAPTKTVAISVDGKSYRKDLCTEHLAELLRGTSAPKRGRPRKTQAGATAPAPQELARRRRPSRLGSAERDPARSASVKRPRGKITDPAILAMRRAALAKARQARAEKRAAAKSSS